MHSEYKYSAFISYSWEDHKTAKRLQNKLETYILPESIRKKAGNVPPKKIKPVFRDKTDMPYKGELSGILQQILKESEYLIVICSSGSAKSVWVDKEIEYFISLGREENIIPFIIEGDPATQYYPGSLNRDRLGVVVNGSGFKKSVTGIIAAMNNLSPDDIWERELKRKYRKITIMAFSAIFSILLIGTVIYNQRNKALASQSLFLADLSKQHLKNGNVMGAMMLALEALPDNLNFPARPFVPEAAAALRSIDLYMQNSKYKPVITLGDELEIIDRACFVPDSRLFVVKYLCSKKDKIRLFDFRNGKESTDADYVKKAELSRLIDREYEKGSMGDGGLLSGLRTGNNSAGISAAFISSCGERALTVSGDNTVKIWSLEENHTILLDEKYAYGIQRAEFSPDGEKIISGSGDGKIRLWDCKDGRLIKEFDADTDDNSISLNNSGDKLLTVKDNTAFILDMETGQVTGTIKGHSGKIFSAVFSPDGKYIVTASGDNTVKKWDAETGNQMFNFRKLDSDTITTAIFSPDGNKVLSIAGNKRMLEWDANTGDSIRSYFHPANTFSTVYSPDGKYFVTISDEMIKIWDSASGNKKPIKGHTGNTVFATFSPGGKNIITVSPDEIKIWDTESRQNIITMSGGRLAVFNPDETKILTVTDSSAVIWDYPHLSVLVERAKAYLNGREFTDDEREKYFLERFK